VSRNSWWRRFWGIGSDRPSPAVAPPSTLPIGEPASKPAPPPPAEAVVGVDPSQLRVGVVTTVGHYREHNEDNFFIAPLSVNGGRAGARPAADRSPLVGGGRDQFAGDPGSSMAPQGLFLVADGMGGQLAGEQASRIAVEIIPKMLGDRGEPGDDEAAKAAVRQAVAAANKEIMAQSHLMPEYANMGTTVALALFRRDRAYVAGIGDSRIYRLRGGRLEQLTRDHSLANALEEAGTIPAEEVENHKFKHVLYLYLGCPDARDGPEDVRVVDVRPGDQFLLASDGLTGVVRNEQIIEDLRRHEDPQGAAQALVDRALANDSKDNITCVVIHAL